MATAEAFSQEAMLGQHAVEHARDATERLRHGQQPEGVAGGRRIDDDVVPRCRGGQPLELHEPDQFVDAGQGEGEKAIDVVIVEIGPAGDDRAQRLPPRAEPALQRAIGIQLDRQELSTPCWNTDERSARRRDRVSRAVR